MTEETANPFDKLSRLEKIYLLRDVAIALAKSHGYIYTGEDIVNSIGPRERMFVAMAEKAIEVVESRLQQT